MSLAGAIAVAVGLDNWITFPWSAEAPVGEAC